MAEAMSVGKMVGFLFLPEVAIMHPKPFAYGPSPRL